MREDWLHYQLHNFNRWRRQLQRPVAGATELAAASVDVPLAQAPGTTAPSAVASVVSITGKLSASELAKMSGEAPSFDAPQLPPPSSPSDSQAAGLEYQAPETWRPGPTSAVRRASFVVDDGSGRVTIAVTSFSAQSGPQISSPLPNVNRWRGQLGLARVSEAELSETTQSVEIGGEKGLYVALESSEGAAPDLAMRAAMVRHGDQVWFFKLDGPRPLVERESEHFQEFIRSVKFVENP
jgi:hypothetical protein